MKKKQSIINFRVTEKAKKIIRNLPWGKRGDALNRLITHYEKELKKFAA
jgi:hypothetical protein